MGPCWQWLVVDEGKKIITPNKNKNTCEITTSLGTRKEMGTRNIDTKN